MFYLQNGDNKYRFVFQHFPAREQRLEYAAKVKLALENKLPMPRPPRQHRSTTCTILNEAGVAIGQGTVRQWPTDSYDKETARRSSLTKALHQAFPGTEGTDPSNRQLRIQAWTEYWKAREAAFNNGKAPEVSIWVPLDRLMTLVDLTIQLMDEDAPALGDDLDVLKDTLNFFHAGLPNRQPPEDTPDTPELPDPVPA